MRRRSPARETIVAALLLLGLAVVTLGAFVHTDDGCAVEQHCRACRMAVAETRAFALFAFEEVGEGPWRGQLGARYEHQNVKALGDVGLERSLGGASGSAGLVYKRPDGFGAGLTLAFSQKLPNAEELYSNGPHIATGAFEIGDPDLQKEKSLGRDIST